MDRRTANQALRDAKTEEEWNGVIDEVKKANNGDYPDWWYEDIIASGVVDAKAATFLNPLTITPVPLREKLE